MPLNLTNYKGGKHAGYVPVKVRKKQNTTPIVTEEPISQSIIPQNDTYSVKDILQGNAPIIKGQQNFSAPLYIDGLISPNKEQVRFDAVEKNLPVADFNLTDDFRKKRNQAQKEVEKEKTFESIGRLRLYDRDLNTDKTTLSDEKISWLKKQYDPVFVDEFLSNNFIEKTGNLNDNQYGERLPGRGVDFYGFSAKTNTTPQSIQPQGNRQQYNEQIELLEKRRNEIANNPNISNASKMAINKLYKDAIDLYDAPTKNEGTILGNAVEGTGEAVLNRDFWTAGATELARNLKVNDAADNFKKEYQRLREEFAKQGDANWKQNATITAYNNLSDRDKALIDAYMTFVEAGQARQVDMSGAYKAGKGIGESLGFMVNMMIGSGVTSALRSGVKSITKNSSKAIAKGITKHIEKNIVRDEFLRKGLQIPKGATAKEVWNATGNYFKDLGKTQLLSGKATITTATSPHTYANVLDKKTQKYLQGEDATFSDVASGVVESHMENWSEIYGGKIISPFISKSLFRGLPGINKIAQLQDNITGKLAYSNIGKTLNALRDKKFISYMEKHGAFGLDKEEFEEEYVGALGTTIYGYVADAIGLDSQFNDDLKKSFSDMLSKDATLELASTILPMEMMLKGVPMAFGFRNEMRNIRYNESATNLLNTLRQNGYDDNTAKKMIQAVEMAIADDEVYKKDIDGIPTNEFTDSFQTLIGAGIEGYNNSFDNSTQQAFNDYLENAKKVAKRLTDNRFAVATMSEEEKDSYYNSVATQVITQANANMLYNYVRKAKPYRVFNNATGEYENRVLQIIDKDNGQAWGMVTDYDKDNKTFTIIPEYSKTPITISLKDIKDNNLGVIHQNVDVLFDELLNVAEPDSKEAFYIRTRQLVNDFIEYNGANAIISSVQGNDGITYYVKDVDKIEQTGGTVGVMAYNPQTNNWEKRIVNTSELNLNTITTQSFDDFVEQTYQTEKDVTAQIEQAQQNIEQIQREQQEPTTTYQNETYSQDDIDRLKVGDKIIIQNNAVGINTDAIGKEAEVYDIDDISGEVNIKYDITDEINNQTFERTESLGQNGQQFTFTYLGQEKHSTTEPNTQTAQQNSNTNDDSNDSTTNSLSNKIKGGEIYNQNAEQTLIDLYANMPKETAQKYVNGKIGQLESERKRLNKNTSYEDIDKFMSNEKAIRENEKQLDYWNNVKSLFVAPTSQVESVQSLKSISDKEHQLGEPLSMREYILRNLALGGKFIWDDNANGTKGLGSHLGLGNSSSERRNYFAFLQGKDEQAMYPEQYAENLLEDIRNEFNPNIEFDEVFNEMLDCLSSFTTPTAMMDEAVRMHYKEQDNMQQNDFDKQQEEIDRQVEEQEIERLQEENVRQNALSAEEYERMQQRFNDYEQPAERERGETTEEELDDNGIPFVKASDGSINFGEITADKGGLAPAPIRLSEGNSNYGLTHIEKNHGEEIRNAGYDNVAEFIEDVAKNFDTIRVGNEYDLDNRTKPTYLIELTTKKNKTLFIELSKDGSYWNVNSAGIFREGYSKKKALVWTLPALSHNSTAENKEVAGSIVSDKDSADSTSGNSSQTTASKGKDTTKNEISKEKNNKKIEDFGEKIGGARKDIAGQRIKDLKKLSKEDIQKIDKIEKLFSKKQILSLFKDGRMNEQTARQLLAYSSVFDKRVKIISRGYGKDEISWKAKSLFLDKLSEWEQNNDVAIDIEKDITNIISATIKEKENVIAQNDRLRSNGDVNKTDSKKEYALKNTEAFFKQMAIDVSNVLFTYDELDYPAVERNLTHCVIRRGNEVIGYGKIGSGRYYPQTDLALCLEQIMLECPVVEQKEGKTTKDKADNSKVNHLSVVKAEYFGYCIKSKRLNADITFSKRFKSKEEAEKYLQDNAEKLQKQEEDMYNVLYSSSLLQADRIGIDYRQGRDISEQEFLDTFGFRGVEFGNYVTQKERQPMLNRTYDAIMDLCGIVGISPRAFSLGGRLGLAFGARGVGRANAHYEPLKEVINLTRTKGAGSLAHEWLHALDNFLAKNETGNTTDYVSEGKDASIRQELGEVFRELRQAITTSDYYQRSKKADKNKTYWSSDREMFARAFASYIQDKLEAKEYISPILTRENKEPNKTELDVIWKGAFPKPLKKEREEFNPLFDKLFEVIQEKTDDKGNVVLYHKVTDNSIVSEEEAIVRDGLIDILEKAIGKENVVTDNADAERLLDEANGEVKYYDDTQDIEQINQTFNEELEAYQNGTMQKNDMLHLGNPQGALEIFAPNLPIIIHQSVLTKATKKKHNVDISALKDMPKMLAEPIFVFQKNRDSVSLLTEMKDRSGKNVFVSIDLTKIIQNGKEYLTVNEITSIHGRREINIILPVLQNNSLKWVDKQKGLRWISSVNPNDLQELSNENLNNFAKIVQNFENPQIKEGKNAIKEHKVFGGNSGYVGYSMSKRAEQAREEGRFPKTDFKKTYNISSDDVLDVLVTMGLVNNREWHHTSKFGNKTTFYSWADDIFAEQYKQHKKEIDDIVKQNKEKKNPYKYTNWGEFSEEFKALPYNVKIGENARALQEFLDNHAEDRAKYEENKKYDEWQRTAETPIERNLRIGEEIRQKIGFNKVDNGDNIESIRFLKTQDGEVYGFTVNGKIYIDRNKAKADTPIHEYTHLWAEALRRNNPKAWEQLKKEMLKEKELMDYVRANYPEIENEDELIEEVFAHYSGERGRERLLAEMNKEKASKDRAIDKIRVMNMFNKLRRLLDKFWNLTKDLFAGKVEGIEKLTAEDLANMSLSSFLNKFDPRVDRNKAEEQAIIDRAKADGTYMKAPNGKASNLTEKQWVQVRTKAFKDWFGDWELVAKAKAIRGLNAISIIKNTFNRNEIKERYGQIGDVENKNDGRKVTFYKGIFGKMYKEGGLFAQIVPQLKGLFENSILAYSEINNLAGTQRADGTTHKEHRNISSYDNYVAKAKIDGKEYYVRFTVQNEIDGRRGNHSLMVTNVSLYDNTVNVASASAKLGERLDIDSITDAKLQQFFEGARKSEENSSKVVDENGEPLVVYHETDWEILKDKNATFDKNKSKEKGVFYFSNKPSRQGLEYGRNRYSMFLNIKKPKIENTKIYAGKSELNTISTKNDGVINTYTHFIEKGDYRESETPNKVFTVKNPNQIKSATDNVGTFDGGNDDIRFHKAERHANFEDEVAGLKNKKKDNWAKRTIRGIIRSTDYFDPVRRLESKILKAGGKIKQSAYKKFLRVTDAIQGTMQAFTNTFYADYSNAVSVVREKTNLNGKQVKQYLQIQAMKSATARILARRFNELQKKFGENSLRANASETSHNEYHLYTLINKLYNEVSTEELKVRVKNMDVKKDNSLSPEQQKLTTQQLYDTIRKTIACEKFRDEYLYKENVNERILKALYGENLTGFQKNAEEQKGIVGLAGEKDLYKTELYQRFFPNDTYTKHSLQELIDKVEQIDNGNALSSLKDLNKKTEAMVKEMWRYGYEKGLISTQEYNTYQIGKDMYLPLRGWDADIYKVRGSAKTKQKLKEKAKGRITIADDPIKFLIAEYDTIVRQGEVAEAKRVFMQMLIDNRDVLKDEGETTSILGYKWKPNNAIAQVLANKGILTDENGYVFTSTKPSQNELLDMEDGNVWVTAFNGDLDDINSSGSIGMNIFGENYDKSYMESGRDVWTWKDRDVTYKFALDDVKLVKMLNDANLKANNTIEWLAKNIGRITRFISSYLTSKNIGFIVRNLERDFQEALVIEGEHGAGYKRAYIKNVMEYSGGSLRNLPNILNDNKGALIDILLRPKDTRQAYNEGKMTDKQKQLYDDYMEWLRLGGASGMINFMENTDKMLKHYAKQMDKSNIGSVAWGMVSGKYIGLIGECFENTIRFASYKALVQQGISKEEAAYQSKEATVNFARRGAFTQLMNTLFPFFSATINAIHREIRLWCKQPKRAFARSLTYMMLGFAGSYASWLIGGGDDDDNAYKNINDYHKLKKFLFPVLSGKALSFEVPQSMYPMFAIGVLISQVMRGEKTKTKATYDFGGTLFKLFPDSFGGEVWDGLFEYNKVSDTIEFSVDMKNMGRALSPQFVRGWVELGMNENFMGSPINKAYTPYGVAELRVNKDKIDNQYSTYHFLEKAINVGLSYVYGNTLHWDEEKYNNDIQTKESNAKGHKNATITESDIQHIVQSYFPAYKRILESVEDGIRAFREGEAGTGFLSISGLQSVVNATSVKEGDANRFYEAYYTGKYLEEKYRDRIFNKYGKEKRSDEQIEIDANNPEIEAYLDWIEQKDSWFEQRDELLEELENFKGTKEQVDAKKKRIYNQINHIPDEWIREYKIKALLKNVKK